MIIPAKVEMQTRVFFDPLVVEFTAKTTNLENIPEKFHSILQYGAMKQILEICKIAEKMDAAFVGGPLIPK